MAALLLAEITNIKQYRGARLVAAVPGYLRSRAMTDLRSRR
jgi:hypothetical protein